MSDYKYFNSAEFLLASPSCHLSDMDSAFMRKIDQLRDICGFPFVVNSAYRCRDWELTHGRSGNGYHTFGRAVDISCTDAFKRAMIVKNAFSLGINGVGVASTFIHLDDRPDPKVWTY